MNYHQADLLNKNFLNEYVEKFAYRLSMENFLLPVSFSCIFIFVQSLSIDFSVFASLRVNLL